jgi:hypothetical protein
MHLTVDLDDVEESLWLHPETLRRRRGLLEVDLAGVGAVGAVERGFVLLTTFRDLNLHWLAISE